MKNIVKGLEATMSQKRAREIMGKNFFGVKEAIEHFEVNFSLQQLAALFEIPFNEATLEECKDTHILIAVFPMSIIDIRSKAGSKLFYDQSWCSKESFAKDRGEVGWYLVRKAPVPNSTLKTWNEQQALLAKNEETPTARVMCYMIIGHFLATGERLFEDVYVRCSDISSHGRRVDIGDFALNGLFVHGYWGDIRDSRLGMASVRKSN